MKPRLTVTPQTALLFVVAHASARQNQIPQAERDVFALAFIEHVLQEHPKPEITFTPRSLTYWRKAADNWMKNALRDERRRRRGEIAWPQTEDEDGQTAAFDPQDGHPGPTGRRFARSCGNCLRRQWRR